MQATWQTTRALSPPLQSLEPAGPGNKIILILGLFLGIFAAFFVEFLAKVRQEDDKEAAPQKQCLLDQCVKSQARSRSRLFDTSRKNQENGAMSGSN